MIAVQIIRPYDTDVDLGAPMLDVAPAVRGAAAGPRTSPATRPPADAFGGGRTFTQGNASGAMAELIGGCANGAWPLVRPCIAWLFGSVARGDATSGSDVSVAQPEESSRRDLHDRPSTPYMIVQQRLRRPRGTQVIRSEA